ncbi:MAG: M23 family metallopeptidase [Thermotogaceae bacterium]|nr:M23 family metallopeptidase [Thermotogaceae bacterium]
MRRLLATLIVISIVVIGFSLELYPPVDNPRVTATFGEYRPLGSRGPHFHMGVDFSTTRMIGIDIKAAADGYLDRVIIDKDDIYGYVVVLVHEGGYKTLYAHMSDFAPAIKEITDDLEKEFDGERVVVQFHPNDIVFKRGEVVGKSGSTGEAMQPHAHFEVRDENEEASYDPMLFLVGVPRPIDEKVVFDMISVDSTVMSFVDGGEYTFTGDIPKLEILAYSVGNGNRLGLKDIKYYLNGNLIYEISFSKIGWIDFGNVSYVYDGEKSRMSVEEYVAWYKLYPIDLNANLSMIKVNRFSEVKRFPDVSNVKIVLENAWGMKKEARIVLRRVGD